MSRLAIDLSGSVLHVVDGAMGGAMRCGTGGSPLGASGGGKVQDPAALGQALKQLLARSEITGTRALVAVSDALATFRILRLPATATEQEVTATVAKEMPLDPERLATRWVDLNRRDDQRVVYAVAWDRGQVKTITEAVKIAGLEPVAVDLKSACIARTTQEASCIVVDLTSNPVELILVDRYVPQVWHTFHSSAPLGDDLATALAGPIRSVLRFFRRHNHQDLAPGAPVLISGEQVLAAQALDALAEHVGQPVLPLPAPSRVPPNVRHATYLTCLGLLMRRDS